MTSVRFSKNKVVPAVGEQTADAVYTISGRAEEDRRVKPSGLR